MRLFGWINGAYLLAIALGLAGTSWTIQKGASSDRPDQAGEELRRLSKTVRDPATAGQSRVWTAYGKMPLTLEANRGQSDSRVHYLLRGAGYAIFFTPQEVVFAFASSKGDSGEAGRGRGPWVDAPVSHVLRQVLVGANPHPKVEGVDEAAGKVNYLRGNDPKRWRTNIPIYHKVAYRRIYPGIDLVYYGNRQQLEYDFIVAPGADYQQIEMRIVGAHGLRLNAEGDLLIATPAGEIRQRKPVIYQEEQGRRLAVKGCFDLRGNDRVGFTVASHDPTKPLVIDPVLVYSTYLGSGDDYGRGIAVDSSGNAYIVGTSYLCDFPTTVGAFQASCGGDGDAFVIKLNAAGTVLVYSTYLGGSENDGGHGIAVDASGNAYVTGSTYSTNFPTARSFQGSGGGDSDAFIAKLNVPGTALVYSTYLGGKGGDGGTGIAVDASGNAFVTGFTSSTNFPTARPFQASNKGKGDAFVTKLNAAGSAIVFSTYLGGSGEDSGLGITVDSSGNAYVAGTTPSTNFPSKSPFQASSGGGNDIFVAKLNAAGTGLVYSTYLGGGGEDFSYGIALDNAGNAYVTGVTTSTNFPMARSLQESNRGRGDAFVTKLDPTGTTLVYSTYIGGRGGDHGTGIAVDSYGNAYVVGYTDSADFPTANPFQASFNDVIDSFVVKLNAAGSALIYSTYLGGDGGDFASAIALDAEGNAYVTGNTFSTDFPTMNAIQTTGGGGGRCVFVTKLKPVGP